MRLAAVVFAALLLSRAAGAHVPVLRAHLVELTQSASRIVIARVVSASRRPAGDSKLKLDIVVTLHGPQAPRALEILSANYLAPQQRYVFFLTERDGAITSLAPPGVVFAAVPADDPAYRRTVTQLAAALKQVEPGRTQALRTTLIDALDTSPAALRRQAAVDLATLIDAGPGLTTTERQRLESIRSATSDEALRVLLNTLLTRSGRAQPQP